MSTIYAPLNSVNTFRTVQTELPLDMTLSKDEKNELIELEKLTATSSFTPVQLAQRFNVSTTTNAGIHYFCVGNNFSLQLLARNPNLAPLLVFLINLKLTATSPSNATSTRGSLLSNPVVLRNLDLFKVIFGALTTDGASNFFAIYGRTMGKVNIEIFMFLLAEVGDITDEPTKSLYARRAKDREQEVYVWAGEHAPDFAGLPLSWILRAYGFN